MVSKINGKQPNDPMEDLNVKSAIWRMFMNTTLQTAVHLWTDYETNFHYAKNRIWECLGQIIWWNEKTDLWIVRNLWSENTRDRWFENYEFEDTAWRSVSLLCERVYHITNAKVYVFSDSELWMGKMRCDPNATWMKKIKWYLHRTTISKNWIAPRRKIFPESTTMVILQGIQKFMKKYSVNLGMSTVESSSCPCSMTLCGEKDKTEECKSECYWSWEVCSQMPSRSLVFLGTWTTKDMHGTKLALKTKQREGQNCSNDYFPNGYRTWSPNFQASNAFERRKLDIKQYGKKSIHDSTMMRENIEMLLRTVISVQKNWDKNSSEECSSLLSKSRKLKNILCKRNIRDLTM